MTCPVCKLRESRGEGPFGTVLACFECLDLARAAEVLRSKKREERGGTCDACKKRVAVFLQGSNMTRTGAYRSDHLCLECAYARVGADVDQAAEALRRFQDAPSEPWPDGQE